MCMSCYEMYVKSRVTAPDILMWGYCMSIRQLEWLRSNDYCFKYFYIDTICYGYMSFEIFCSCCVSYFPRNHWIMIVFMHPPMYKTPWNSEWRWKKSRGTPWFMLQLYSKKIWNCINWMLGQISPFPLTFLLCHWQNALLMLPWPHNTNQQGVHIEVSTVNGNQSTLVEHVKM